MQRLILIGIDKDLIFTIESEKLGEITGYAALQKDDTVPYAFLGADDEAALKVSGPSGLVMALDFGKDKWSAADIYSGQGKGFVQILSQTARISDSAGIGEGCIVQSGAWISHDVTLGDFVKVSVDARCVHDVVVGECSTVAPDATLLGNVRVGSATYIGAGAIVRQRITIGSNCLVGAGAVVVKDVPDNSVVAGVPAQILRETSPIS